MTLTANACLAASPGLLVLPAKVGLYGDTSSVVGRPTLAKKVNVALFGMTFETTDVVFGHDAVVTTRPNGVIADPFVDATSPTPNTI